MEYMSGGELFDRIVEYEHYTEKQAAEDLAKLVDLNDNEGARNAFNEILNIDENFQALSLYLLFYSH